jgi:hypothetical protein
MSIKHGIIFDQLPLPPSENAAYATDWNTGRRFKSKEMGEFTLRFQKWSIRRALQIAKIQNELKWEMADHRRVIRVDAWLFFQFDSLFTKCSGPADKPRRKKMNDASNFTKALHDCLATMLGIDDSRMIVGSMVPVVRSEPVGQYCRVLLTLDYIKGEEEILASDSNEIPIGATKI